MMKTMTYAELREAIQKANGECVITHDYHPHYEDYSRVYDCSYEEGREQFIHALTDMVSGHVNGEPIARSLTIGGEDIVLDDKLVTEINDRHNGFHQESYNTTVHKARHLRDYVEHCSAIWINNIRYERSEILVSEIMDRIQREQITDITTEEIMSPWTLEVVTCYLSWTFDWEEPGSEKYQDLIDPTWG